MPELAFSYALLSPENLPKTEFVIPIFLKLCFGMTFSANSLAQAQIFHSKMRIIQIWNEYHSEKGINGPILSFQNAAKSNLE